MTMSIVKAYELAELRKLSYTTIRCYTKNLNRKQYYNDITVMLFLLRVTTPLFTLMIVP